MSDQHENDFIKEFGTEHFVNHCYSYWFVNNTIVLQWTSSDTIDSIVMNQVINSKLPYCIILNNQVIAFKDVHFDAKIGHYAVDFGGKLMLFSYDSKHRICYVHYNHKIVCIDAEDSSYSSCSIYDDYAQNCDKPVYVVGDMSSYIAPISDDEYKNVTELMGKVYRKAVNRLY